MTIEELKVACEEQIERGNGYKNILVFGDDEGNSLRPLVYTFIDEEDEISDYFKKCYSDSVEEEPKNYVLLG